MNLTWSLKLFSDPYFILTGHRAEVRVKMQPSVAMNGAPWPAQNKT